MSPVLVALIIPETGKVGIYVTVKLEIRSWFEGKPVIFDALQVAADVFHAFFVTCTGAVGETGALMDGKLDFGVGV